MKARIAKKVWKRTDVFSERNQEAFATLRRIEYKAAVHGHIDWHTMQFNEVYAIGCTMWQPDVERVATRYYTGDGWNRTMECDWPAWDLEYERIDHAFPFFKKEFAEHNIKNFAPFRGCEIHFFIPAEVFKNK